MPADCQLESTQQHNRTVAPQINADAATPMSNNCSAINDSRHHQLINDQEPPDGDETDPDVIPNQYGKLIYFYYIATDIKPNWSWSSQKLKLLDFIRLCKQTRNINNRKNHS